MKKSVYFLFAVSLLSAGGFTIQAQEKLAALVYTTSSSEALVSFNSALRLNDFGEMRKARNLFEKAVQQDPKFTAAYLFLANNATSPQEFAMYLNKAKENVAQSGNWEKLYFDYSESFLTDNLNQRMEAAQKMVSMFPSNARSYVLLGEAYSAKNDIANERKCFEQAIKVDPGAPLGYRGLVNSYLFQEPKDFKAAEQNATRVVSLMPTSASYVLLGDSYRAQNNLQKAKNAYKKAIDTDVEDATAYYKRGHAFTFLGEYDKARTDYQKAGTLDITNTNALIYVASTYLYQGQPGDALQYLLDEVEQVKGPDAAKVTQAKYELLTTASDIAFHVSNVKALQKIVQMLEPLSNEIGVNLGSKEAQMSQKSQLLNLQASEKILNNDLDGAKALLEESKTVLDPIQNPRKLEDYHFLQGLISYRQKDYKAAISQMEQSNQENIYVRYWLAKAYEADGQNEKAMKINREIANYNFNNIGYALVRNEVKQKI